MQLASVPKLLTCSVQTCKAIYAQIAGLKDSYRKLYSPVQDFIQKHKTLADSIKLSFDVRISEKNFVDSLSDWINKGRSGSWSSPNFPVKSPYGSPGSVKLLVPPTCFWGGTRFEVPRFS